MLVFDMFKVTSMILMTLNMSNTNMPLNLLSISDSLKKKNFNYSIDCRLSTAVAHCLKIYDYAKSLSCKPCLMEKYWIRK